MRYDRTKRNRFVVYFKDQRMGDTLLLDLHFNAKQARSKRDSKGNNKVVEQMGDLL